MVHHFPFKPQVLWVLPSEHFLNTSHDVLFPLPVLMPRPWLTTALRSLPSQAQASLFFNCSHWFISKWQIHFCHSTSLKSSRYLSNVLRRGSKILSNFENSLQFLSSCLRHTLRTLMLLATCKDVYFPCLQFVVILFCLQVLHMTPPSPLSLAISTFQLADSSPLSRSLAPSQELPLSTPT